MVADDWGIYRDLVIDNRATGIDSRAMTRQTSSQVNRTYRQRKAEKAAQTAQTLERYETALQWYAQRQIWEGATNYQFSIAEADAGSRARQALTTTSHEMEGK